MGDQAAASSGELLRIRWATWWPIPYWTDRFNVLASLPGVDLEIVFLQDAPSMYGFKMDPAQWRFRSRFLSSGPGTLGFYRPSRRLRDPRPLVAGPRTVHLVMPYADPTFVAAAALARLRRAPYWLFVANTEDDQRSRSPAFEAVKRWVINGAAGCLATGPLQVEYARHYRTDVPVRVIGNPIDVARLEPESGRHAREITRSRYGWQGRIVLGYVGRLAHEKDLGALVRAAAELGAEGYRVSVALAGTGPCESELRLLAEHSAVDVRFLGFVDGADLGRLYGAMDIFVLPSLSEPWGLVVNEAMAMGLPVVVSDRVGARHLLDDANHVFRAGEGGDLTRSLRPLLASSSERARVGRSSMESIRLQAIDGWAGAVVDFLGAAKTDSVRPE
jgi:glycosyltransferase involved in cell wall biosynthesis